MAVNNCAISSLLRPAGKREILVRILRNLVGVYRARGDSANLLEALTAVHAPEIEFRAFPRDRQVAVITMFDFARKPLDAVRESWTEAATQQCGVVSTPQPVGRWTIVLVTMAVAVRVVERVCTI